MSRMDLITVCDKCLQASCWQGIFMCQESKFAGTVQKPRMELTRLNLEHSDYLKTDRELVEEANKQAERLNNRNRRIVTYRRKVG